MGHARRIVGLFVSSDGKTLVSASEDPEVRVWSLATGRALKVLDGPPEGIESMVLSPNGSVAAAGGSRGSIRVWGLPEGNVLLESKVASGISALAINRNNNVLAAGLGDGDLVLWSLDSGAEQRRISLGSWIRAMIVAPDGSSVIAGTNAGVLNVCSMLVENEVQSFRTSTSGVSSLRLATKKNLLAVGSVEGQILLYQWPEMKLRSYLFDPTDNNTDVKGISYNVYDKIENRSIAYTMPCGTAIPVGATCICNCVPGRHTDVATSSRGRPSPPAVPGSRRDTLTLPCTPTPPPPGYVCTCNCVPGR
jgi:WD40 repeat protein